MSYKPKDVATKHVPAADKTWPPRHRASKNKTERLTADQVFGDTKVKSKLPDWTPTPLPVKAQPKRQPPMDLSPSLQVLVSMLTYKRPAGSDSEEAFIDRFIRPLNPHQDSFGNLMVEVGENPNILWSSHTDTVHHSGGRQAVIVDGRFAKVDHSQAIKSNCLGADCGAGVWLMIEMILHKVPGLYIFHREEECGGNGSAFIAKSTPQVLTGIEIAIAFDRRDYSSIISHQNGARCCSKDFISSLAAALGGNIFKADDGGTFTDTANYVELIDECTNLSVGYFGGHGPAEKLNLAYIEALRDLLCSANLDYLYVEQGSAKERADNKNRDAYWDRHFDRRDALGDFIYNNQDVIEAYFELQGVNVDDLREFAKEL